MLTQICQYLRNWFERDIYYGSFTVSGGTLTLPVPRTVMVRMVNPPSSPLFGRSLRHKMGITAHPAPETAGNEQREAAFEGPPGACINT